MSVTQLTKIAFFSLLLGVASFTRADRTPLQIPSLGDTSAGLISTTEEYEFGRKLVRQFRASLPESSDPFTEEYLFDLITRLVQYSDLTNPQIELLVVQDKSLNAFAAPGGIVGVNTGTFLVAQNEQQLASIIAHELAHLSQRHYARKVNESGKNMMLSMAAMLASILVATTTDSDAGIAAMSASQAAAIESNLKFSREMEQEADRIGMHTLLNAGFDPYGMPAMFEVMMRNSRYRSRMPEWLMSHPLTESRISDSMARASRYPRRPAPEDSEFQIVKARILVESERNSHVAVKRFRDEVAGNTLPPLTAQYGLVMALTAAGDTEQARKEYKRLATLTDKEVALAVARADIDAADGQLDKALATLSDSLQQHPTSHPLNVRYAELLMRAGRYSLCESVLKAHVKRHPNNSYVWYLLAEAHGLAGNILDVHKARAEYFILLGIYPKAEIQLRNALRMTDPEDFQARAKIEQRLKEVRKLHSEQMR